MTAQSATESPPAQPGVLFPRGVLVAAVPVVLVNIVAFSGQLAFLRAHLPWPLPGQVTMAVALESIAIYLAYHAHLAQLANDSALRLRLASYAFGLVIGACNYSHYAGPGWRPTFPAVAIGLMSASSPWLWAVHSRRSSRDALLARGLIEPHALRLGATRWTWHPFRSARVMWQATWQGVTDPAAALAMIEHPAPAQPGRPRPVAPVASGTGDQGQDQDQDKAPSPAEPSPQPEPVAARPARKAPPARQPTQPAATRLDRQELAAAPHNAARIRYALDTLGPDARPGTVGRELADAGYPVHPEHVKSVRKRVRRGRTLPARAASSPRAGKPSRPQAPAAPPARPEPPVLTVASANGARAAS